MSAFCALILAAPGAEAGSYAVAYSGGSVTSSGQGNSYPSPFKVSNGVYSGGGNFYPTGAGAETGTVVGPITATFTYQPSGAGDTPPPSVIVEQDSSAQWSGMGAMSGSCDDGIGQSSPTQTVTNRGSATVSGTLYAVKSSPGSSFTVSSPTTPTATVSVTSGNGNLNVSYTAKAYPITINLTGPKPDQSGKGQDIPVGLTCQASIQGVQALPAAIASTATYLWKVPDAANAYQPSANTNTTPGNPNGNVVKSNAGPLTNVTASCYWSDVPQTLTFSCTVTLTAPPGQGTIGPVTPTATVNLVTPTVGGGVAAGVGRINSANATVQGIAKGYWLYAGSTVIVPGPPPEPAPDVGGSGFATVAEPSSFSGGQ